jgi:hypothetical protein
LPASWPQTSEGMFFLASASPDENDNATEEVKKTNNRGVVKLRLISPSSFFNSPADEDAKKRASSVVCSLICSKDLAGSGLSKNLTLNMCVEAEAVYIVSSIAGGFTAWCINADDFSSMLKGDIKAIPAFKYRHAMFLNQLHLTTLQASFRHLFDPTRASKLHRALRASSSSSFPLVSFVQQQGLRGLRSPRRLDYFCH